MNDRFCMALLEYIFFQKPTSILLRRKLMWFLWIKVFETTAPCHWSLLDSGKANFSFCDFWRQWLTVSSIIQESYLRANNKAQSRAGEFPTSWVVTESNSRHSLSKARYSPPAQIISVSTVLFLFLTYKSRGNAWRMHICLLVRAPLFLWLWLALFP